MSTVLSIHKERSCMSGASAPIQWRSALDRCRTCTRRWGRGDFTGTSFNWTAARAGEKGGTHSCDRLSTGKLELRLDDEVLQVIAVRHKPAPARQLDCDRGHDRGAPTQRLADPCVELVHLRAERAR